jgi:hypothetical protein
MPTNDSMVNKEGIYLTELNKSPKKTNDLINRYIKEGNSDTRVLNALEKLDFAFFEFLNLDKSINNYI